MAFAWTEKLSVGNAVMDSEHRDLIRMAGDLVKTVNNGDGSALEDAFEQIEKWLLDHFKNEEFFARAVGFDFSRHRSAQQYALKELQYLRDEWVGKRGVWSDRAAEHFARSLKRWAIDEHILKLDMLMKPALQEYGYDFMPEGK